jgi:hypothetical protein
MAASTDVIPKTLKGPKGHVLTWRKKVEFVRSSVYPRVMPPAGDELRPVLGMTDEELAEALRPAVLRGGHEYIGECPGESVTRLRAAESYRRTPSFSPLVRAKSERLEAGALRPMSGIIGVDTRVVRRDNTEYPWRVVLQIWMWVAAIDCQSLGYTYAKSRSATPPSMDLESLREVGAVNTGVPRPKVPIHRKLGSWLGPRRAVCARMRRRSTSTAMGHFSQWRQVKP